MDFIGLLNSAKPLPRELCEIREYAAERYIPLLSANSERLLSVLVQLKKPERILEIGTAIGYSGLLMLLHSEKAFLHTVEMSDERAMLARENFNRFGVDERARIFLGDAEEIVPMLTGKYDFVFLDGPKGKYIEFLPYLLNVMNRGGVLVCDNVLYKGLVENIPHKRHKHITIARNMRSFLDKLTTLEQLETVVLNIGDGVSVSVKKGE